MLKRWPPHIELTLDLLQSDLAKLISFGLESCIDIKDDAVRNSIRSDLEAGSTVMFLRIKGIFKELRSAFCPTEIESILQRAPDELDQKYARLFSLLMSRLHGRPNNIYVGMERKRGLLALIVGASRPLTLEELRIAYSFSLPHLATSDPERI